MESSPKASLREIFLEAAEMENPVARLKFLHQACRGDAELRQQVESLLAAEAEAGPPREEAPSSRILDDAGPGSCVGNYCLVEKIGEGGCGVVFRAEQEEPVRRQVALKIIKLGMNTHEVVARFEAERQALAMMDHPGIAQVYDAGATDTGRPYFVMELVHGTRITEYCDQNRISTRKRLDLFIHVCQTVQHAHQKGIVHRDIKPSNILVTEVDGAPLPKIIDFGIAKAIEGRLTDQTLFTAIEQFMGTPAYMSPEQAAAKDSDIDTRSDIYSLGVLLYELLAGDTPFNTKTLLAAGMDQMRQTICETEPDSPSMRLGALDRDGITAISRARESEPITLIHDVNGDLDWIVMKCLEKDRGRRYETVNGLALDLRRHLDDEPVTARPPKRFYILQKTIRRNKLTFIAAGAVVAALVIGLGIATWQFVEKSHAEREQYRLREVADIATAQANQDLLGSLKSQARFATLSDTVARRDSAVEALTRAAEIEPSAEMLEIAITALSLFQVRDLGVQVPLVHKQLRIAFNPQMTRYVWHGGEQPEMDVLSFPDHDRLTRFNWNPRGFWDFVEWLPDGEHAIARHRDGPMERWNMTSSDVQWSIPVSQHKHDSLGLIDVDPRGQWIAHIEPNSKVEVRSVIDGQLLWSTTLTAIPISLAIHPRRAWLAIGTKEDLVVYAFLEDRLLARREQSDGCGYAAWSPSGVTLAHSGYSYVLELWEAERAANSGQATEHTRAPGLGGGRAGPCFSPNGMWLANSDEQGMLTVRHASSIRPLTENLSGYPVTFSPDGKRLFCRQGAAGANAFEMSPSECHFELEVPFYANPSLPGIAISPDDRWLAATSYSTGVFVWDLESGGPPSLARSNQASSPCFNHSGNQLLTCFEAGIQVWDFWAEQKEGHRLTHHAVIECDSDLTYPFTRTFSEPEQIVISTLVENSPIGSNWIIQRDDFSQRRALPSLSQQTTALSPDGNWLAQSSFFSPVYLRNLTTEDEKFVDPEGGLLAFSPDGSLLTAGRGGLVRAWETNTWTKVWDITTKTVSDGTGHCAFRPQGDLLATLGSIQDIFLVRPSDGKVLLTLVAPRPGPIARLCFSDSGRMLAASTEDGRVQVWRLDELERQLAQIGLDWGELAEMPRMAAEPEK